MLVVGTAVGMLIYFSPRLFFGTNSPISKGPQLRTGGTSAIFVVAENLWKGKYSKDKGVEIVCESAGTTAGVERMLDRTYTIAFTHAPVSAKLRETARNSGVDIIHIPLLLCGVVPAYHIVELKGKAPLNFTGKVLAEIFLGKIVQWNDPALKAINPGVDLPARKITVVHREDSSGTTELFTEYLAAVSPAWREKVGPPAAEVKWPLGIAASRNQGVAIRIHEIDGAIGYVDRLYVAFQDIVLDYGAVQNRESTFVRAEPANLTAAVRAIHAQIPEDLTFNLIDKPGKDSYPIAGAIYAVCSDKQSETNRKRIGDFLRWAIHDGQADVAKTGFAPLPLELVERVDRRLDAIKSAP
ncbi:MAG: phosphate ABC transporter substrate-binding protein PstS [Thermoguttaceae bacterium]